MFRSPLNQLVFALGTLALGACAEDRSPTQPESGTEPAPRGEAVRCSPRLNSAHVRLL
jgi:hypothetical protein